MIYDLSGEEHYKKFIADACKLLDNGDVTYCYYIYQVKKLKEIYGDELIISYNEAFEWWTCRLKM